MKNFITIPENQDIIIKTLGQICPAQFNSISGNYNIAVFSTLQEDTINMICNFFIDNEISYTCFEGVICIRQENYDSILNDSPF